MRHRRSRKALFGAVLIAVATLASLRLALAFYRTPPGPERRDAVLGLGLGFVVGAAFVGGIVLVVPPPKNRRAPP